MDEISKINKEMTAFIQEAKINQNRLLRNEINSAITKMDIMSKKVEKTKNILEKAAEPIISNM
jgi:hypothetical protein